MSIAIAGKDRAGSITCKIDYNIGIVVCGPVARAMSELS
jgi:hypothetical protein